METARLDKIISDFGGLSRSQAREAIKSGRVTAGGVCLLRPEDRLALENAELSLDGKPLNTSKFRYFAMNKPEGVVCATEDAVEKTVISLLPPELAGLRLFPVGRLDKDTTGLLLLTNDGELGHRLTAPRHSVEKRYEAWLSEAAVQQDIEAFRQGVSLKDGSLCLPALLELDPQDAKHAYVTISQGMYHQVKRMFAARGKTVVALRRLSVGGLMLDETLAPGQIREIYPREIREYFGE